MPALPKVGDVLHLADMGRSVPFGFHLRVKLRPYTDPYTELVHRGDAALTMGSVTTRIGGLPID
jgi:hypothetical protein